MTSTSSTTTTNTEKFHSVEYGQVDVDNQASTTKVNKKLKSMVALLSIFAVLLVVCVSGVSTGQIEGDDLASATGGTIRTLKDVLAYNEKHEGEHGERRKLAACFATSEASACASSEASSEATSEATSEASTAASACALAGATSEESVAEYNAVYAAVYTYVFDNSIAASTIDGCGVSTQGMGNTACNRFSPVPFFILLTMVLLIINVVPWVKILLLMIMVLLVSFNVTNY
jgi:hypothetical protein